MLSVAGQLATRAASAPGRARKAAFAPQRCSTRTWLPTGGGIRADVASHRRLSAGAVSREADLDPRTAPKRATLLELARGGTLFLDEIGELEPALQGKLLRALQDRRLERVGGARTLALDARVVNATKRDLYFRLAVCEIALPPLRARLEDLPALVVALLAGCVQPTGARQPVVGEEFLAALAEHD